jgi:DsbC/DsbD-like thiol-disulfide interchange protein
MMKRAKLNMKAVFLACIFVCLTAAVAPAQAPGQTVKAKVTMASQLARPEVVYVYTKANAKKRVTESVVRATVVVEVLPGYHINDHHPSLDYLIPTEVKLEPSKQATVKEITYPKGEPRKFAFSDAPLSVYEGTVRVDVALEVEPKTVPGDYEVKGQLGYQACNDHACLPPANVPLSFSFKVARRVASTRRSN